MDSRPNGQNGRSTPGGSDRILFERGSGTRVDYILASQAADLRIVRGSAEVITDNLRGGHAQIAISLDAA